MQRINSKISSKHLFFVSLTIIFISQILTYLAGRYINDFSGVIFSSTYLFIFSSLSLITIKLLNKTNKRKLLRIIYIINLSIIIIPLLLVLSAGALRNDLSGSLLAGYYLIVFYGFSFIVSFLILNIWSIIFVYEKRMFFIVLSVLLLIWVAWSIYTFPRLVFP